MIQFILLILTILFSYLNIKAETLERKLMFITISIFIDLAWFGVSLFQYNYIWAFLWFLISLLDLRAYKNTKNEIESE
jgi:hypothetical protein